MTRDRPVILQIIPQLETGGAELSAIEITEAVVRAGGRMIVASRGGRLASQVVDAGGELLDFPAATKNPVKLIANARKLAAIMRREKVALIHARSRAPAWSALMAARNTDTPFVTTYHGAYSENGWLKNRYNSVMARGDVVIANSKYTAGLIRSRYGIPDERLRVIYRGVDVERFDPAAVSSDRRAALRKVWGVAEGARIILQAARMTSWKGHDHLIEAVAMLDARGALGDAVVVMAGDPQGRESYMRDLTALIDARGLAGKVLLVGHCADMPAAFALAHVAVVGSDGKTPEAFGRAAAEAQAAARPVIAADFGAPPETVRSVPHVPARETTGWLVAPADPDALGRALGEALDLDQTDHAEMGSRARKHVLARFTDEAMKRQTLAIYDALLGTSLTLRL